MDLHGRKLAGDRTVWVFVVVATFIIAAQAFARPGTFQYALAGGWAFVLFWLVFVGELGVFRRKPRLEPEPLYAGNATLIGRQRIGGDGTRAPVSNDNESGVLATDATGVWWSAKGSGERLMHVRWDELWGWRHNAVLRLFQRMSGYLSIVDTHGNEYVFHVQGARRWNRELSEARVVGPPRQPVEELTSSVVPPNDPQPVTASEEDTDLSAPATTTFEPVIGLECHVELSTNSKVFCGCPTTFGGDPNTQICPVCTGQPGTLPVLNEAAVAAAIKIGLAFNCKIAPTSMFHRKNYFYPDMPKNYQISQYDVPICGEGWIEVEVDGETRRIGIERVHLEEDTGKITHGGGSGRIGDADFAMIDYNRAGVPLVEIVSKPDMFSPEEAKAYLTELRATLETLGVSDVRMDQGSLRCDANVSVRPAGQGELGTKAEVKNINSIRSVGRALEFEISRQSELLASGGRVVQETRHFDESTGRTLGGRVKEGSDDYRYFPEPDLVPVEPTPAWIEAIRSTLPELPAKRRARFVAEYALSEVDARTLTASKGLADAFEAAVDVYGGDAKLMARWYIGELAAIANTRNVDPHQVGVEPSALAELQRLVDDGTISISVAKGKVLQKMAETGDSPAEIVERDGLSQISDSSELDRIVDEVIAGNQPMVDQVKSGKISAINALVGGVMKATKGRANPEEAKALLAQKLEVDLESSE